MLSSVNSNTIHKYIRLLVVELNFKISILLCIYNSLYSYTLFIEISTQLLGV